MSNIANYPVPVPSAPQRGQPERIVRESAPGEQEQSSNGAGARNAALAENDGSQARSRQRLVSAEEAARLDTRPQSENENLSFNARKALRTFADNTPTPEQRLGIELVGVDTFA